MPFSAYLANKVLDKVYRNTDFTVPAVYVSLHTGDPGPAGANEVKGGTYARQVSAWDAAAARTTQNAMPITFTGLPAATLTHFGKWDASTSGNFLGYGLLGEPAQVQQGNSFQPPAGGLSVGL